MRTIILAYCSLPAVHTQYITLDLLKKALALINYLNSNQLDPKLLK